MRPYSAIVIDPSSSHLAYSLVTIEGDEMTFHSAGMLWTKDKWTLGQKLLYMFKAFKLLINTHPDSSAIYTEAYFINFKSKIIGSSVIPTVNNLLQMSIAEIDTRMEYHEVAPTKWRKTLGIKPTVSPEGKKDYKVPTRDAVNKLLDKPLPEMIQSNITGKDRALPHDLSDSIAIAMSIGKDKGCTKFSTTVTTYLNPVLTDKLRKLKDEIE